MKRMMVVAVLAMLPLAGSADTSLLDVIRAQDAARQAQPAYEWQCVSPFLVTWATITINWQRQRIAELEQQLAQRGPK